MPPLALTIKVTGLLLEPSPASGEAGLALPQLIAAACCCDNVLPRRPSSGTAVMRKADDTCEPRRDAAWKDEVWS